MSARRILPLLEIDAEELHCGACSYLWPGRRCGLFTGELEAGALGAHRADECLSAEQERTLSRPERDLRDRFAMASMQGLLASAKDSSGGPADLAAMAYEQADAMLVARKPKVGPS